jgi:glutamate synthase (NADPH/NADH) large chain
MTGGTAVILGPVGDNFGAGMTGGMAFVYDSDGRFADRVNPETVVWQRVETGAWEGILKALVMDHFRETQSRFVERLLSDWDRELPKFWQIVPKEILARLPHPLTRADEAKLASTGDE